MIDVFAHMGQFYDVIVVFHGGITTVAFKVIDERSAVSRSKNQIGMVAFYGLFGISGAEGEFRGAFFYEFFHNFGFEVYAVAFYTETGFFENVQSGFVLEYTADFFENLQGVTMNLQYFFLR